MRTHILKTDKQVFELSWMGMKPFEIRKDDRNYLVGDILILKETEWDGASMAQGSPLVYTDRQITRRITSKVTGYGLQPGWCVLGIEPI